jgi:hypothetical protein
MTGMVLYEGKGDAYTYVMRHKTLKVSVSIKAATSVPPQTKLIEKITGFVNLNAWLNTLLPK